MATGRPTHDPVEVEFERRLEDATSAARTLLGPTQADEVNAGTISELIAATKARLTELAAQTNWRDDVAAHAADLELLRQRHHARSDALAQAEQAIGALRAVTAPSAILSRAPTELCERSRIKRAILSLITEGVLIAEAAHFENDPGGAIKAIEELRRHPPRLQHPLIEAEIIRRRRATIVTDADLHPRVHRVSAPSMGWRTYIAAPIVVRGEVIGIIHADGGPQGRSLDVLDGDVLWTFVRGLADVYETTSLRRSLRGQQERMRQFVEWLTARSLELSDTWMQLIADRPPPPDPPGRLDPMAVSPHVDDRLVFQDVLSRRELEVLRLLAQGEINGSIAAQLVISEATVKFHVVNLLRKLQVANRAEAVARYHRLVQRPNEGS